MSPNDGGRPAPPDTLQTADPFNPTTRFERRDVNHRAVALTAAGILLGTWFCIVALYLFFYFGGVEAVLPGQPSNSAQAGLILPPEPRLQSDPAQDLRDYRAREDAALSNYAWIDRKNGVVAIPIERAIDIVAQRGIPPQPPPRDMTYFDPHVGTRDTGFEGKVEPEPR